MVYRDLVERFGGRRPSLAEVRETVISIRRSKSMVIDEHDENRRSVGSFFKNPVLSQTTFDNLARTCRNEVPHFPASAGYVKVPAAWLIEQSGFQKGYTMGKVGISTNHTLAIVNLGGATAHEVVSMKDVIRSSVYDRFDIELVPEPVFVGRF
jgi:UDP-N-acetylmuramate dehydrogenase